MPTIQRHLKMFKPLLEAKVEGYNEDRPWWSTHRPRTELLEGHVDTGGWADLGVMNRWGDNKLLAGLAPAHSVSLSGLHVFTGESGTSAAYLVGLINSTPILELAEALAPGNVSQSDIAELGLPQLDKATAKTIEDKTRRLANLVKQFVTVTAQAWRKLPDALRADINLAEAPDWAWARPHPREAGVTSAGSNGSPTRQTHLTGRSWARNLSTTCSVAT
jgi:hypothetical protein